MQNESILKEITQMCIDKTKNWYYLKNILIERNFTYLENYILSNANIDEATKFAIQYKKRPDLNQKKFEQRVLNEGSFKNLYNYLYEIEDCDQKALLTKILKVATKEELKRFSCADKDREEMDKATLRAYSNGYDMGYDPY